MRSQVILAGMAFALTGASLINAIHQGDLTGVPYNGSLTNNYPPLTPLLTNSFIPPELFYANPHPLPALESASRDDFPVATEHPMTPGVYVTHPYVIAVLVPGGMDPGLVQDSLPDRGTDDLAKSRPLQFEPVK